MMRLFKFVSLIAILFGMNGCGGGGASGSNQTGGTFILGNVNLFLSAYTPTIMVSNTDINGSAISNAVVTVNGQTLVYDTLANRYGGYGSVTVTPDAAGKFNLSVTVNGSTYTASASALTSAPVITMPSPFRAASTNTISWTPPGGMTGIMNYYPSIQPNSGGAPVFGPIWTTATSVVIPANTTVAGTAYMVVVPATQVGTLISNAASGSNFGVSVQAAVMSFTAQ